MPGPTLISLAVNQTATFPALCVVCGKSAPGAKKVYHLSLPKEDGGPLEITVEAPCCRGCARGLSAYWIIRGMAGIVWFFVGGLPGWVASNLTVAWWKPLADKHGFVVGLPFILIGLLSWVGGFIAILLSVRLWPPAYLVDLRPDAIDFMFQNAKVADSFAEINGVRDPESR